MYATYDRNADGDLKGDRDESPADTYYDHPEHHSDRQSDPHDFQNRDQERKRSYEVGYENHHEKREDGDQDVRSWRRHHNEDRITSGNNADCDKNGKSSRDDADCDKGEDCHRKGGVTQSLVARLARLNYNVPSEHAAPVKLADGSLNFPLIAQAYKNEASRLWIAMDFA
ncbi:hypothetical protein BU23DRAFT_574636 [Bimuria novae-zelandiae CBS 107.79]|uniref:Uncharacterized protein n=1 Tax=Bimuria novae-zelandiae CBS 107.79 TaxID=1447943 RepID=A0A6A5ULG4_9PLEO|nr:hypothetical protein BU23DRAFT_574636 [Bimuria novae-zelandiae CBS 107.79]